MTARFAAGAQTGRGNVHDLLELAITTADAAGAMLVDQRPADVRVAATKSSPTDVVTEMDRAAEKLIIERIRASRPGDAFLGEEGGASSGGSGVRWIIDPIDGTVNYLYGLPDWAVSIAAEVDGEIVAGVVTVPTRGELYTAARGEGSYLVHRDGSTEKLSCNTGIPLERALIATGFGYFAQRRARQAEVLLGVLPRVRDIRRGGSAAVDLCSVASGRVDGYFERGPQEWDVAAGGLIVREAGGFMGGLNGRPASAEMTISAGPGLYEALHDLLAPLSPERD
ncbi:inositol monophosphatase family protein [Actinomadura sp. DC4]|uniref:inositol monophosphatase family protein n=1 Tax=Actinomadura sp. DC4 TaxID=3055069 RepID=UPI0025B09377|nr:inositol monophosphatase family protein [Actinomadura sp. DC4]MDN3355010.1 inositol monophosphatase family protein [Actinomadura sp. DC4]